MMLEGFHDNQRLAWFQAIVYKDDGKDGKSVPFDGLGHRVCSLRSCKILICKVDNGVLRVFDQERGPWQAILILTRLKVGESRIVAVFHLWVEIFELAFAFVQIPELLLCSTADKQALISKRLLLKLFILIVDLFEVRNRAHGNLRIHPRKNASKLPLFEELFALRARVH